MSEKRTADDEIMQDNVARPKLELKIKHFYWSTVFDTEEKFTLKFPQGFLKAKLEDETDYPVEALEFPMIRIVDILNAIGIVNKRQ